MHQLANFTARSRADNNLPIKARNAAGFTGFGNKVNPRAAAASRACCV